MQPREQINALLNKMVGPGGDLEHNEIRTAAVKMMRKTIGSDLTFGDRSGSNQHVRIIGAEGCRGRKELPSLVRSALTVVPQLKRELQRELGLLRHLCMPLPQQALSFDLMAAIPQLMNLLEHSINLVRSPCPSQTLEHSEAASVASWPD
jgi:hypothetical protein